MINDPHVSIISQFFLNWQSASHLLKYASTTRRHGFQYCDHVKAQPLYRKLILNINHELRMLLARTSLRGTVLPLTRAASTARGLQAILQKNPHDVVITYAQRTALGRAKKGQLKDFPVDEILAGLFKVSESWHIMCPSTF